MADDGAIGVVKRFFVITRVRGAGSAHTELRGELEKSRRAQIVLVFVPNDDVFPGHAGIEQAANHGCDDGGACAAD